jgi:hypothetical protein
MRADVVANGGHGSYDLSLREKIFRFSGWIVLSPNLS